MATVKVRLTDSCVVGLTADGQPRIAAAGTELDLPADDADGVIAGGRGVLVEGTLPDALGLKPRTVKPKA
jgi:hypothetical protein